MCSPWPTLLHPVQDRHRRRLRRKLYWIRLYTLRCSVSLNVQDRSVLSPLERNMMDLAMGRPWYLLFGHSVAMRSMQSYTKPELTGYLTGLRHRFLIRCSNLGNLQVNAIWVRVYLQLTEMEGGKEAAGDDFAADEGTASKLCERFWWRGFWWWRGCWRGRRWWGNERRVWKGRRRRNSLLWNMYCLSRWLEYRECYLESIWFARSYSSKPINTKASWWRY